MLKNVDRLSEKPQHTHLKINTATVTITIVITVIISSSSSRILAVVFYNDDMPTCAHLN